VITGPVIRRSLADRRGKWHRVRMMNPLRQLRRDANLTQHDFAELLGVNTFRMWDSGLRPAPARLLLQAQAAVEHHTRQAEWLTLSELAKEFRVHIRTRQAAVRTGRLSAHFSVQSVFGRPRRLASRAATEAFIASHYRRFSGQASCPAPLPTVPHDYPSQLRALRRRLRLTQGGLARRIGAAGKAVVYQWESRKRTPSPVLWHNVLRLERSAPRGEHYGVGPNPR
jgi:DNA-binding transcriptional regulator YiaG